MYRTNDGQVLNGSAPEELVTELHKLALTPESSDRAFMVATANRVLRQFGQRVRHDRAEDFIDDLVKIGLLIDEADTSQVADQKT